MLRFIIFLSYIPSAHRAYSNMLWHAKSYTVLYYNEKCIVMLFAFSCFVFVLLYIYTRIYVLRLFICKHSHSASASTTWRRVFNFRNREWNSKGCSCNIHFLLSVLIHNVPSDIHIRYPHSYVLGTLYSNVYHIFVHFPYILVCNIHYTYCIYSLLVELSTFSICSYLNSIQYIYVADYWLMRID